MKQREDGMIEFTDAELVILEWYSSLLDKGMGHDKALKEIRESVPQPGAVSKILQNGEFRSYLRGEKP